MRGSGRSRVAFAIATGLMAVGASALAIAPAAGNGTSSTLFASIGSGPATTDPVPAGICFVTITADGGHGGNGVRHLRRGGDGGLAASVTARVGVTPDTTLTVLVGGAGDWEPPGGSSSAASAASVAVVVGARAALCSTGGGGGASAVATNTGAALVVAGAGGGGSGLSGAR